MNIFATLYCKYARSYVYKNINYILFFKYSLAKF